MSDSDSSSKKISSSVPIEQNSLLEGHRQNYDNILSDASSSKSKGNSPGIIDTPSNNSMKNSSDEEIDNDSRKEIKKGSSKSRSRSRSSSLKGKDSVMKNGCCKDCMKAFNKNGRSCICQVPKNERRYLLPEKGCHICGCQGCNPSDVRKNQRSDLKRQYKEDRNFPFKNQRLLDSDDEELKINDK